MNLNTVLFGYYPYVALIIFAIASLVGLQRNLRSWRSGQAEMCHIHQLSPLSKAFHISMLALLVGHTAGLLVPFGVYHALGITASAKQLFAIFTGGAFGILCLAGLLYYLKRRLTDPEKRATGTRMDVFVLLFLLLELVLGLGTLPVSWSNLDGHLMLTLSKWAQHIFTFQVGAADLMVDVPWIFKLHLFFGISLFVLIPFSHLVHIWTVPLRYVLHPDQFVFERNAKR